MREEGGILLVQIILPAFTALRGRWKGALCGLNANMASRIWILYYFMGLKTPEAVFKDKRGVWDYGTPMLELTITTVYTRKGVVWGGRD
jgi:hypothetical protein